MRLSHQQHHREVVPSAAVARKMQQQQHRPPTTTATRTAVSSPPAIRPGVSSSGLMMLSSLPLFGLLGGIGKSPQSRRKQDQWRALITFTFLALFAIVYLDIVERKTSLIAAQVKASRQQQAEIKNSILGLKKQRKTQKKQRAAEAAAFLKKSNTDVDHKTGNVQELMDHEKPAKEAGDEEKKSNFPFTVHKLQEPLQQSSNVIVTAYYPNLKQQSSPLEKLNDAMIIFTQGADSLEQIRKWREHALDRTVVIELPLDQLPIVTLGTTEFWQHQLERDPQEHVSADLHHHTHNQAGFQKYWLGLSQTWLVAQAIQHEWFKGAQYFAWMGDIAAAVPSETMLQHTEIVPKKSLLWTATSLPNLPKEVPLQPGGDEKAALSAWISAYTAGKASKWLFHSSSFAIGKPQSWLAFHQQFAVTVDLWLQSSSSSFIGQFALLQQTACLVAPSSGRGKPLCAYHVQEQDGKSTTLLDLLQEGSSSGEAVKFWWAAPPPSSTKAVTDK